jgi:ABC-2 type transport system ATP-binding protein
VLELIDLHRAFGDVRALQGVSFAVPRGQVCGFVGRNGAGKTTTMRIVCGLLDPDAGEVRWDGQPAGETLRRAIGYMPEERGLYPKMRVADHLAYLAELHGRRAADARRASHALIARLGLGERAGDRVEQLSLGNQQRVQLAAALVHDPALLVLDEPFSGLDPLGADVLAEALLERARAGVPVLFSSHQLELVERLCEAVVIVDAGRVVAAGGVAELREQRRRPAVRVDVQGAPAGWANEVPGVLGVEVRGGQAVVALADAADPVDVLDAARAAGRVTHFSLVEPTLAELFREVVEEQAAAAEPVPQAAVA